MLSTDELVLITKKTQKTKHKKYSTQKKLNEN